MQTSVMQNAFADVQQRSMGALIDRLPAAVDKGHLVCRQDQETRPAFHQDCGAYVQDQARECQQASHKEAAQNNVHQRGNHCHCTLGVNSAGLYCLPCRCCSHDGLL